ncbi:MAG TPA: hypothetical protein O0Y06_07575 [Methanocorpusculum sp.]|nr:hypothetical protein [Methanocorpusculum sp.]HJK80745.1 hypothetical protein [Methanocorpusculum sp.]
MKKSQIFLTVLVIFFIIIVPVSAEEQRYHPEPKAGYHDPFIYQAEIGNVTFHFTIMRYYLDDNSPDLYLWFTPEIKERQDNREQNTVFKFEADTKDLVVSHPEILEDDILYQNYMMLNLEGYNTDWRSYEQWLDKGHETYKHRHTLDIGQKHTITVSCWDWFCTRPDGSTFEEHSRDFPQKW